MTQASQLKDLSDALPTSSSEALVDSGAPWLYRSDTVVFADGTTAIRQYLDHPGAVEVVALDERNRVLMIRQYRHAVKARLWEFPAGLLDQQGESLKDAAHRELFEETEHTATELEELGTFLPTPGSSSEVIHFFLARGIERAEHTFEREYEEAEIEQAWFPLSELVEAVQAGLITSGPTQYGILMAALRVLTVRS